MFLLDKKQKLPNPREALPGRAMEMSVPERHFVNQNPLTPPFPETMRMAMFGLGCFWGAERKFWQIKGVFTTAVGYAGGFTPNPLYEEVCSGMTGHNEVVRVLFDPSVVDYRELLRVFWETHDPTQGMRQGNDVGTQYRSQICTYDDEQQTLALASRSAYQKVLSAAGLPGITTEIIPAPAFYYAESYHQQYLARNPNGYCGLGGTGIVYGVG
uniref:Peptide methionine sulfoxide reductase MsrA n=1 Tax=Candidatus Kentrum sp. UNK TaxID=2126344 RepID=A0A451ARS6_9GAMM|nr:MAG: peptide-methionine (S)-S-oxide reductase [Candidatus Kentron sp. UNK]VFK73690.1 MAG: peptide-methionine (S)-S-oxide reductase [Candidatus Kentron sp. UNK]